MMDVKTECTHKPLWSITLKSYVCELCRKPCEKSKKKTKYGSVRTEYNGKKYPSIKQATYAACLDLKIKEGSVIYYLEEMPLRYAGGGLLKIDFIVFYRDGTHDHIDVKGKITAMYLAKKRIVEATYPIKIKEV